MKKLLVVIMMLCTLAVHAQYYGTSVFTEGFDGNTFPASWSQDNGTKDDPCRWVAGNNAGTPFSKIDANSQSSLEFTLNQNNKPYLTLTSLAINLTGKSNIMVGFYGYELTYCLRGVEFLFRITRDNGVTWTNLFDSSRGDSYNGELKVEGWNLYKYGLPSEFDGSTIKLQFIIDGKEYSGYGGTSGYLDGIFVSERYAVDLVINKLHNYPDDSRTPLKRALSSTETITVDFTNTGSEPVSELELYYQVNDNQQVIEQYRPAQPIQLNQKVTYSFTNKADLSEPFRTFVIKAGVRKAGDGDLKNNEMMGYAENITAGIPYKPKFTWDNNGVPMVDSDEWTTDENEYDAGYWDMDRSGTFWSVDNKYSGATCDAYLFSRPVLLEKGKTYEIHFNAWVDSQTAGEPLNGMKVLISKEAEVDAEMTGIWENKVIGTANALNSFARYTATESGPHYFVFNCISKPTPDYLKVLPLNITEVKKQDVGIISLISPYKEGTYMFTANETVSVLLRNFGSEPLRAADVSVSMQLDNGEVVSERIPSDLSAGQMLTFTFTKKLDLSNINAKKVLTVQAICASDQNQGNNKISARLASVVSGVPYLPDFGKGRYPTNEPSLWTIVDKNADGYTFSSPSEPLLDSYVFAYGGNATRPTIIVKKSDEQLFSRPIWLESGKDYRFSFLSRVGKAGGLIPVTVALYRLDGDQRVLVKEIASINVTSDGYVETLSDMNVDKSGIYEFCFGVVTNEPIDYKVYLGDFKLHQLYDYNLELTDILLPSSTISCYNKFPVGVVVTNAGKKEISSFTIKAQSPSIGSKQTLINKVIAPKQSVICYFNEDFVFNGEGTEQITTSVELNTDQYADNNSKVATVSYVAPATVPYSTGFYTYPDGWSVINNDRDASKFEFAAASSGGFRYVKADNENVNDWVATRCMALEKGKLYSMSIYAKVMQSLDTAAYEIYAYNPETKERLSIAVFRNYADTNGSQYIGYFEVPENGSYCICFEVLDKTRSLMFYNRFEVKEAGMKPDIRLVAVTAPIADAVFTADETVKVTYVRDAKTADVGNVPFTCKIGDKVYHAAYWGILLKDGVENEVVFHHVDLSRVGEYKMKITAGVLCDATPDDNVIEHVVNSLPVVNVSLLGLVSPESGVLNKEEPIVVKVKNSGKGDLKNIPLTAVVIDKDQNKHLLTGMIETALPQGESVDYTFSEKVDMYAEGIYEIELSSSLEGDVDLADNIYKTSVVSTHKEFDAGVSLLVSPKNGLLGEETVTVTVHNYTDMNIFNIPVVSVIKHVTDAAIAPVSLTGVLEKLPADGTADYTFTQKVDMSAVGDYSVTSYTGLKNDINQENDTLKITVRSCIKDAGVILIVSPESGLELQSQSIVIRVKNFGEVPLSQIPVRYKVGSIPQLGTVKETIEPGETLDYTFASPYEFVSYKVYTLTAYTELEGDFDTTNNTCVKEIENRPDAISSINAGTISVYPNPVKDVLNVEAGEALIRTITILNNEGLKVLVLDAVDASSCLIPLSLSPGNYMVKINTDMGIIYRKVIVRKA